MPEELDINKVIQRGSRQMDLGDLAKMGHKKVRVIDERRIRELISQAVQHTIEREAADTAGRARRVAAEQAKAELEERLVEYQHKLEQEQLASKEVEKLRAELSKAQGDLKKTTAVIESEKKRIAEDSQKEFQKLLKNATQELETKKGAYEKALREMIENANRVIPREELDALPVISAEEDTAGAVMLDALHTRVATLGRLLDSARADVLSRDQDIAMGAAEHRRQENEINRLKKEADELRKEVRDKERQADSVQQDVAVAAAEHRKDKEVIQRLGSQLDDTRDKLREAERQMESGQQDVAVAAADRRKDKEVIERLGRQLDEARDEIREKQRQIDQREQDVAMAALEQRRLRDDRNRLSEEAAKVATLDGEIRRLNSERELLLGRLEEFRERERTAAEQVQEMASKLAEGGGGVGGKASAELMEAIAGMKGSIGEEIQRQVSWALSAQKTGASGIDPGLQLEALFSQEIETNIESVKVEEQKGKSLTDKLAKLREAKLGGEEKPK